MQRHGLARVEVCLALAVTGVLAAALLPTFAQMSTQRLSTQARARENARRTACQSNLKQLAIGIKMYVADWDEMYPPATGGKGRYDYGWAASIQPYIKNTRLLQCPSERHPAGTDLKRPRYTDYWYNRNLARVNEAELYFISNTFLLGDGDGGAAQSSARYALNALPRAWAKMPGSPARRHLDGANYAYTDGHIKWLKPQRVTTAKPSATVNTFRVR